MSDNKEEIEDNSLPNIDPYTMCISKSYQTFVGYRWTIVGIGVGTYFSAMMPWKGTEYRRHRLLFFYGAGLLGIALDEYLVRRRCKLSLAASKDIE